MNNNNNNDINKCKIPECSSVQVIFEEFGLHCKFSLLQCLKGETDPPPPTL